MGEQRENYTILHMHSFLSSGTTNIDSITNFRSYVKQAKECGMKAMCITEHGNLFEWVHKKEEIEKAGMKYLHGIEIYVTETLEEKIRDNYHCVLIAKNYEGVKEINRLSSTSYNRNDNHFYYAPRISFDELINTSD
ncbi:MAG: PHP domain-containing protein, partial [Tyzzerella sp.]|nr:PHP domain-containing protein [Tyzzerella sp.]